MSAIEKDGFVGENDLFWLRQALLHNRVPQRQTAKAIGIEPSSLNRALKGTRRMTLQEFERARAFIDANITGLRTRVAHLAWAQKIDAETLARRSGIALERVEEIMHVTNARLEQDEATRLAEALGVPLKEFGVRETAFARDPIVAGELDLAVFGTTTQGRDGWYGPIGGIVETRRRPPVLIGVADALGLYVGDAGLLPRYEQGEVLLVHMGRPARPLRWVVIERADRHVAVGRLRSIDRSETIIEAPGDREVRVEKSAVRRLGVIVGTLFE